MTKPCYNPSLMEIIDYYERIEALNVSEPSQPVFKNTAKHFTGNEQKL